MAEGTEEIAHFSCITCETTACGAPYNYTAVEFTIDNACINCPPVAGQFVTDHMELHLKKP